MTSQPHSLVASLENTPNYPTWVTNNLLRDYYDTEWGVPVTDERGLFEALSLEAFRWGSPGTQFLLGEKPSAGLLRGSIPSV